MVGGREMRCILALFLSLLFIPNARAEGTVRIGLLLSYKGVFASISESFENGWKVALEELSGGLRKKIEIVRADDEGLNPAVAVQRMSKLIKSDKVHIVAGGLSSGVSLALREVAHRERVPLVIGFAVADQLTNELCSPYLARTSFSGSAYSHSFGNYFAKKYQRAATLGPDYAGGHQIIGGFAKGFEEAGGKVVAQEWTAFRTTKDWGPYYAKLKASDAQMIFGFYGGAESIQAVKTHAAFGLTETMPLHGEMWLYDESLWSAMGDAVVGATFGTIHLPGLPHAANRKFVAAYQKKFGRLPDLNSVLGYENGKAILLAIKKVGGDLKDGAAFIRALGTIEFDAPRGKFKMDPKSNDSILSELYIARVEKGADGKLSQVLVDRIAGRPGNYDKCSLAQAN